MYHASLLKALPGIDRWNRSKVYALMLHKHSALRERIPTKGRLLDWYKVNDGTYETHVIQVFDIPLITDEGINGILVFRYIPHSKDHLLTIEILTQFLARKGYSF